MPSLDGQTIITQILDVLLALYYIPGSRHWGSAEVLSYFLALQRGDNSMYLSRTVPCRKKRTLKTIFDNLLKFMTWLGFRSSRRGYRNYAHCVNLHATRTGKATPYLQCDHSQLYSCSIPATNSSNFSASPPLTTPCIAFARNPSLLFPSSNSIFALSPAALSINDFGRPASLATLRP